MNQQPAVSAARALRGGVALLALAAAGAGSCADPVSPLTAADVAGTYALATVNGQALPVLFGSGPGITSTIVFDTVTFAADGTWREPTGAGELGNATPTSVHVWSGTWRFDARTSTLWQRSVAPHDVVDSLALHVGARAATLSFDAPAGSVTPDYGHGPWVFARVR